MKRKRLDSSVSTSISSKILCLQNGSHVEVQLDDGKWHAGIILQCQSRRYLVQVQQQQHWLDFDLIRLHTTTLVDQKRNAPFEYRPGQFLRTEAKSSNKIVSDHDLSSMAPQIESSLDLRKKRLPKTTNTHVEQQKQAPFVWKPSTNAATQNRRLSSISPDEHHLLSDDRCRTRTLSNSTTTSSERSFPKIKKSQTKKIISSQELPLTTSSNSAKTPPTEEPQSEVVIFRPIIRFIDPTATINGKQSKKTSSSNAIESLSIVSQSMLPQSPLKLDVDLENVSISRPSPIIVQEEIVSSTSSFQGLASDDLVDDELPAPSSSSLLFDDDNRLLHQQQIDNYPSTTSNQRKSVNEDDFSSQFDPIDSRSSSTTSTDIPYVVHQFEESIPLSINPTNEILLLPIKFETKSACFLETPPPSLPDMHLVQENSIRSESPLDKPSPQFKSKRKQHRPQRKEITTTIKDENFSKNDQLIMINKQQTTHGKQINGVFDRLLKQKEEEDETETNQIDNNLELVPRLSNEHNKCDPGYLSDEYGEPVPSQDLLTCIELETILDRLRNKTMEQNKEEDDDHDRTWLDQLRTWLNGDSQRHQQLDSYRLEHYKDDENRRMSLISDILQLIFSTCLNGTSFEQIPDEIKTHVRTCLNNVNKRSRNKKKTKKAKRLANAVNIANKRRSISKPDNNNLSRMVVAKRRNSQSLENISTFDIKSKKQVKIRKTTACTQPNVDPNLLEQQQIFLSSSSPLTPIQFRSVDNFLSPSDIVLKSDVIEEIPILPRERDIYEVIHCLCEIEIDNGFMIQCEACLCWSHCECVGVTATCIPAFFKCNICSKAEADRTPEWSLSSLLDDDTAMLFLTTSNHSTTLLSCSRRMWHLREQIAELKRRYTPMLRSLQNALRCDDLIELFQFAQMSSDQLVVKIERRREKRHFFESVAFTLDHLVDCVCSSSQTSTSSSCLFIDLPSSMEIPNGHRLTDRIDVLISHLCDDDDTRQVRLTIQNRYDQLLATVDQQIQTILFEHRNIQMQMESELDIVSSSRGVDQHSYDVHEIALRTAIERLKC